MKIIQAYHPLLNTRAFITEFERPLGETESPPWLLRLLSRDGGDPRTEKLPPREEIYKAYRRLLRWGGFRASGRSKPAAEYLVKAAEEGILGSINAAVDVLNGVSLHTGVPIGVVDLDLCREPLSVDLGKEGESYIFNKSGQEINLKGLICMRDAAGPCANPVKDSQRTKTSENTRRTLTLVWGSRECMEAAELAYSWQRELLEKLGARTYPAETVFLQPQESD
ncbi:hypothetical protein IJT93_08475 [bacterium]|nr:hypothetical protein [bacterium]